MQLPPTDGHFGRLVERIVAVGPVVVLCAPPGFYKGRLAHAAARRIGGADNDGIAMFGLWEHGRDPRAAAEGLLAGQAPVTVIEEAGAADGRLLAQVLDRIDLEGTGRRVIFTIHQPGDLPLARMALRAPIDVLDADALRLRPQDIASTLKASLRPAIRARIQALAGDWPVALDVLTRWAAAARDVSASWSDLDIVRESGLGTFIAQEVLASLTPAERAALTHASWLDAPDLATLLAIDSQRREDTIAADLAYRLKGLVDRQGQRIHLHRALRILLRDGPQNESAGEDRDSLLLAMADHYSGTGQLVEAATLASMAGNSGRIREYADAHGALRIWIVHGFPVLSELVEKSSAEDVAASLVLRMMECIVHLKGGRIRVAQHLYETLAAEMTEARIGPSDPLARDLEIVRVTLLVYGCSLERTNDLELLSGLIAEQAEDAALRSFLSTLSCILNSQRARFDVARASLIDARAQAKLASSHYNVMFLYMHEAAIHLAEAKLKQARTCMSEARRHWQQGFAHDMGVETVIASLSGSIEYESGQLTSARNSVRKSAHRMPDSEAWFDIYFLAYETMMRLNRIDHGLGTTLRTIEDEVGKLRSQGLPRVADLVTGMGLCIAGEESMQGNESSVPSGWITPEPGPTASWQEHEVYTLARFYRLRADNARDKADALLETALERAAARGLERSRLRFLLARFSAACVDGEDDRARDLLGEAIMIGAHTGMRQIFRDMAGPLLSTPLARLREEARLGEIELAFAETLSNRLRDRGGAGASALSEREREVLRLLEGGGSDKRIARQLSISEHGVRYHLKSIYKKLGVHDRVSAIAAGRRLATP